MKQLLISCAILLLVFAGTLVNGRCVARITDRCHADLNRARVCAAAGDWEGAQRLTRAARETWESHNIVLHTLLRHAELDGVQLGFCQTEEHLNFRQLAAFCTSCTALMEQLSLLTEAEQLTFENVL